MSIWTPLLQVVKRHTVGDRADQQFPRGAMREDEMAVTEGNLAVPATVLAAGPQPTRTGDGNLVPETLFKSRVRMGDTVPGHQQRITHHYTLLYPPHPERKSDPHYVDFSSFRRRTRATAKCAIGQHRNDYSECTDPSKWPLGLELHHHAIEFSLQQGIDLAWLEVDYPGVSDPNQVGAWVESAANLMWLCERHHRGLDGVHVLSASDYEAIKYVRGLVGE